MASRHICASCLRGLRLQIAEGRRVGVMSTARASSTNSRLQPSSMHFRLKSSKAQVKKATTAYQTPRPGPSSSTPDAPKAQSEQKGDRSKSLAQTIREKAPSFTETYIAYGTCEVLVKECARVADYDIPEDQRKDQLLPGPERGIDVGIGKGWWYEQFGLTPSFNTWAQITLLHMWLLTVRLRQFPAAHAPAWHQHLTDHFFFIAEERMAKLHGLSVQSVRNRYLKDLFIQWRGLTAAYDQGIVEGDAMLAAAIWRNVCGGNEDVDLEKLAMVTSYVRSVLKGLEEINDEDISTGQVVFEDPSQEASVVKPKSKLWNKPFPAGETGATSGAMTSQEAAYTKS